MTQKEYTLDIPMADGKDGYLGTFFNLYIQLVSTIRSDDVDKNPMKIQYLSTAIYSLMPDKEDRIALKNDLKKTIAENKEEYMKIHSKTLQQLTRAELDFILVMSNLECLGNVSNFIDRHIGMSKKNKVSFIAGKIDEKDIEIPEDLDTSEVVVDIEEQK